MRLPAGAPPAARSRAAARPRRPPAGARPLRGGLPRTCRSGPARVRPRLDELRLVGEHRAAARRDTTGHRAGRRAAVHLLPRRPRPPSGSRSRPAGQRTVPTDSRHRTLRSTIEWSYDLLTPEERRLFRHLSVFPDGVGPLDCRGRRCGTGPAGDPGSMLSHLVDASMIDATFDGPTRYRMLETIRIFGLDRLAAAGEGPAARTFPAMGTGADRWIDAAHDSEREPEADAVLRRELPNLRSAWHIARRQRPWTTPRQWCRRCRMPDRMARPYRDVGMDRGARPRPGAGRAPARGGRAGLRGRGRVHAGRLPLADRLARAGLNGRPTPRGHFVASARCPCRPQPGGLRDVSSVPRRGGVATRPSENLGIAALALTYAGDIGQAQELNDRMAAAAVSPTLRAFGAYVSGEINGPRGARTRPRSTTPGPPTSPDLGCDLPRRHRLHRPLTVLADDGREPDVLRGYREVIDYWDRAGNWTQQWVTLRNLAQLLRRLGDDEPALLLEPPPIRRRTPPRSARPRTDVPLQPTRHTGGSERHLRRPLGRKLWK